MTTKKIPVNLGEVPMIMRPIREVTKGDPPPPLDYGFLHPFRETLLYGRGSVGKGVIASYFAALDTKAGKRVGILAYEPHPDEWFRRIEGFGGNLDLVDIALPVSEEEGWLHGPIWGQAEDIRYYVNEVGVERLIIDSLMPATKAGGDSALADPSIPDDFYGATRLIGVPSLVLGHTAASTTRDNLWKPWGSVYWVNYSRIAWAAWHDPARKVVELTNQKTNVYGKYGPYEIDWAWKETLGDGVTPATLDFGPLSGQAMPYAKSSADTRVAAAAGRAHSVVDDLAPTIGDAITKRVLAKTMKGNYSEALKGIDKAVEAGVIAATDDGRYYATGSVVPTGSELVPGTTEPGTSRNHQRAGSEVPTHTPRNHGTTEPEREGES